MALLTLWLLAGFVTAPFIGRIIARADRRLQASQGAGQVAAVDVDQSNHSGASK